MTDNSERERMKIRAELDQAAEQLVDMWPPIWANLYQSLIGRGIDSEIACRMVEAYILSNSTTLRITL